MSQEIPLDVIYKRVDEVSVDLEKQVHLSSSHEESSVREEEKSSSNEKKRCKRKHRCRNMCACFGVMTTVWMMFYSMMMLAVMMRLYMNMNQCFHSKENVFKENSIADKNIHHIHLDIVSGFVVVGFHNKSEIEIRVWDKGRSKANVDAKNFDSGVKLNNSTIFIHSITPAFDFRTCQHAEIEIFIPYNYTQKLSLTGLIKLGQFIVQGYDYKSSFNNIDVVVELGTIELEHVFSNSLKLHAEVGGIEISDSIVPETSELSTHIGSIYSNELYTKNLHSVNRFGCNIHQDLTSDIVKVDTKFGYSNVYDVTPLGKGLDLTMNTEYGRSLIFLDSINVTFNLGTTKGHLVMEYEDGIWLCKVDKYTNVLMDGKCSLLVPTKSVARPVKIDMNTKYGVANLVVDQITSENDDE